MGQKIIKLWIAASIALGAMAGVATAENRPVTLEDLAFMVGHWKGQGENAPEEVWLEPEDGVMPGFFRWSMPDGTYVLEALSFIEDADGVTFYFKHMDPQILTWEKAHANTYRIEEVVDNCLTMRLISDSPGVPAGIRYCQLGADTLQFTGAGEGEAYEEAQFKLTLRRLKGN